MDPSHIIIWNVRGLNSKARQDSVRMLVELVKADVVCLQETKMEDVSRRQVLSMLGSEFDNNFLVLPSAGASGGIFVAWRAKLGAIGASRVDRFCASVQFCPTNGIPWWLTALKEMMRKLSSCRNYVIRAQCIGPWALAGDFNLIYKADDKNNSNINRAMMGRFRKFINDSAIKELPLIGRKYTWTSSSTAASPTLVKLDRVFCSVDWEQQFPDSILQSAATNDSDHCPLILGLRDNKPGKKRFQFEAFWPRFDGFQEAVQQAWGSVERTMCPLEMLSLKFKATAKGLQSR